MAADVNDACARKEYVNEPQMHLVERHLVGEELRACFENAEFTRASEIVIAKLIGGETVVTHPKIGQRARKRIRAREPAWNDARKVLHEGQFVACRNLRMRTQDLLDHGRTRTRVADNENRLRHGRIEVGARNELHAAASEKAHAFSDEFSCRGFAIAALLYLAYKSVRLGKIGPCLVKLVHFVVKAPALEQTLSREAFARVPALVEFGDGLRNLAFAPKQYGALERQIRRVIGVLFCFLQELPGFGNVAPRFLELAPSGPDARILRRHSRRLAVPSLALFNLALQLQAVSEVIGDGGLLAIELQHAPEVKLARCRPAPLRQQQAHDALQRGIERHQAQAAARQRLALLGLALVEQHRTEFGRRPQIVRIELYDSPEHILVLRTSGLRGRCTPAQQQQRRHVIRKLLQRLFGTKICQAEIAATERGVPLANETIKRFKKLSRAFAGSRSGRCARRRF